MTSFRPVLFSLLVFVATAAVESSGYGELPPIENAWHRIVWDEDAESLSISAISTDNCRIASISLPEKVESVQQDAFFLTPFGSGRCWYLSHGPRSWTRVTLYDNLPLVAIDRHVANETDRIRTIDKLPILTAKLAFDRPVEELVARGSAGLTAVEEQFGSYVFGAVAEPESGSGVVFGWASNRRGQGIVFPGRDGDQATLRTRIDYGDLRLPPGGEASSELLLIGVCDDVRDGLEQYADATAKYLDIQLRPLPSVYCTWYHAGASDEERLAKNTDFASTQLKPWGLSVMQIDDKWQPGLKVNGPRKIFDTHDPEGPYPSGMKATADHIRSQGMTPGIWFMPFAGTWLDPFFADKQDIFYRVGEGDPAVTLKAMKTAEYETDRPIDELPYSTNWAGTSIDCTNPKARQYVRQMASRMSHDWGYKYFKMDGFHTGTGSTQKYIGNEYQEDDLGKTTRHDPSMTPLEGYQKGMEVIREAAGGDVFFLGCCMVQNLRCFGTTFGHLDAMRVGPDNGVKWDKHDRGPRYGGRYYFLNKRVWHCDPDPFYVRTSLTMSQATTLASFVALSGQLAASSYDYYELPPERLDIIRRVMPTHDLTSSRPLDFLRRDVPHEWLLTDDTRGAKRTVVGHFNWSSEEEAISLSTPLEELGLDPAQSHVGFDYWSNTFLSSVRESLDSQLEAGSCRIISLYPESDHPQVVSTSRHITQGIVDLLDETWDASTLTLSGVSRMVPGDPYELRIVVPETADGSWRVVGAQLSDESADASAAFTQQGRGVRVTLNSAMGGDLRWQVRFTTPAN